MASVEEVKVHVAASVEGTQQAVAGIQGVVDRIDEALNRLRLTAIGSVHPSVLAAIAQLEQAPAAPWTRPTHTARSSDRPWSAHDRASMSAGSDRRLRAGQNRA
jgi:hypothetical protein